MHEIKKGTKISSEMIDIRRPGDGLSPFYYDQILSRTAKLNISKETPLTWDMIE
jgi:sialic acid synthase SpsE